jgi:hypothetical protein
MGPARSADEHLMRPKLLAKRAALAPQGEENARIVQVERLHGDAFR